MKEEGNNPAKEVFSAKNFAKHKKTKLWEN